MGSEKDIFSPGVEPRQKQPAQAAGGGSNPQGRAPLPPNLPPEVQLELERLRAERDAIAAELQEERAERLRAEERLRMLEREKLEQMRQGAASREKLASELEEARLRAMRAEARQAALEADTRLSEIESRRRDRLAESHPPADEIAEAPPDEHEHPEAGDQRDAVEEPPPPRTRRGGVPPPAAGKDPRAPADRSAREAAETAERRFGRFRLGAPGGGERERGEREGRPAPPAEPPGRPAKPGARAASPPPSRSSAPERPSSSAPSRQGAREPGPSKPGPGPADQARRGSGAGAKPGASSRPRLDREQLERRLAAGERFKTTERFRQFQPVAQTHIKVCDWLAQASTLAELEELSEGLLPRADLLDAVALFFERAFVVFE